MNLNLSVARLKGVGPKTEALLNHAGVFTLRDLFYYLPRRYEDYSIVSSISALRPGKVVIRGQISQLKTTYARRRRLAITSGIISDSTGSVRVVWFNQVYRARAFEASKTYLFSGNFELRSGKYQLTSPTATLAPSVGETASVSTSASTHLLSIYKSHKQLQSADFARLIAKLRSEFAAIPDLLPAKDFLPDRLRSFSRAAALFQAHFPASLAETKSAHAYLAYEEVFALILASRLNQLEQQKLSAIPLPFDTKNTKTMVASLPFDLTSAQRRSAWEILQDLERPHPMNRLLQGDVGSGKTLVSAIAAFQAVSSGHQVALLAPTAILAAQHAETFNKLLSPLGIKIALLTSATKSKAELKRRIKSGEAEIIIGTHALLTDDTVFKSLALCIIDEQHRFGVNQRHQLLLKSPAGRAPHLLAMTATPIPRSLQLTVFGDLDISIIDQMPAGRTPVKTTVLSELELEHTLYPLVRATLQSKSQIYWICKNIDPGTQSEAANVKAEAAHLRTVFPGARIEFLHGRMSAADKDQMMSDFAAGTIDVLVSTTVVEVGVNVPNATLIVIRNAEGYGLAQLHQLRGRVGRGHKPSECFLIFSGENNPSLRLQELAKSTDGFHLAEVDLKLRGPGEIYGSLQHGVLDLRIANFSDTKTIAAARRHVDAFLQTQPDLLQYEELATVLKKYQQLTILN